MMAWCWVSLLLVAQPPNLAAQIQQRLATDSVMSGTFEQSKQLKGFKRPLKSRGTYSVTAGQGVQWNTLAPFPSELTVRSSEIVSQQGGAAVFKLEAKNEPNVRVVTQVLFSLLAGDFEGMSDHFSATGEVGVKTWAVELTPRSEALRKFFSKISVAGDTAVRTVKWNEPSGDFTVIQLMPVVDAGVP
jgi:hypothetical protein